MKEIIALVVEKTMFREDKDLPWVTRIARWFAVFLFIAWGLLFIYRYALETLGG